LLKPLFDFANQDRATIFGTPNNMVFTGIHNIVV